MKITNQQRQNLIGVLVILNLCFIWGNSLLPPHTSNAISDRVTEIIQSVFALSGVLTALIDETIQLFNGRTSAVKDVWIDSGGFALGMLLLIAFLLARDGKRQASQESPAES